MPRLNAALAAVTLLLLTSCMTGDARTLELEAGFADLTGLDVDYLQSKSDETADQNSVVVESLSLGSPLVAAPFVLSLGIENEDLHHGVKGQRTGYRSNISFKLGLGLAASAGDTVRWDTEGKLVAYERSFSLLYGFLYRSGKKGDASGEVGFSTSVLAGMFGYREGKRRGYLTILWIPIPVVNYESSGR